MFIFCCSFIIVSIIKSFNIINMVRKPDRKSVLLTLEKYWHGVGGKYDPTLQHMTPAATMDKFSNFTKKHFKQVKISLLYTDGFC